MNALRVATPSHCGSPSRCETQLCNDDASSIRVCPPPPSPTMSALLAYATVLYKDDSVQVNFKAYRQTDGIDK